MTFDDETEELQQTLYDHLVVYGQVMSLLWVQMDASFVYVNQVA